MANAANLINFGGSALSVGDWTYSAVPLSSPTYLPLNNQYASYLASSYPTLAALYTTPVTAYSATGVTPASIGAPGMVVYGNGIWVMALSAAYVATSVDGVTWLKRPTPTAITKIAYGNGRFIGVTAGGATCSYSFDGIVWVLGTAPPSGMFELGYANGNFFHYRDGAAGSNIHITTNGIVWSTVTFGIPETNLAYGNGTIVIAASPAYNNIQYSKDNGFSWSSVTVAGGQGLAYGNGVFVLMPANGATAYSTSADGITWTARTFPAALTWTFGTCITFGNGVFLAVSATSGTTAYSSPDGINWTLRALPSSRVWNAVAYGGPTNASYFVCTGNSAGTNVANINLSVAQTTFTLPLIPTTISNTTPYIKAS